MNPAPTTWLGRVVRVTATLLGVAIALSWAWNLIRPLLPVIVVSGLIFVVVKATRARRNEW